MIVTAPAGEPAREYTHGRRKDVDVVEFVVETRTGARVLVAARTDDDPRDAAEAAARALRLPRSYRYRLPVLGLEDVTPGTTLRLTGRRV